MIKNKFEISLRDYDKVERRGKISQFKKWWNIFPSVLFSRQIVKVILELGRELNNDSGVDEDEEEKIWKASSHAKINAIESCYLGLVNVRYLRPKANHLFKNHGRKRKFQMLKSEKRYIEGLKEHGGFTVENEKDLERVRKNILFRKDRYDENYSSLEDTQTQTKKKYLLGEAYGVYAFLNQTLDLDKDMVMDYIVAKKTALERAQTEQNVRA